MKGYFYAVMKKNVHYYAGSKGFNEAVSIFSVGRRVYARGDEDSKDKQAIINSLERDSVLCYSLDDLKEVHQVISEVIAKEEKEGGTV